MEKIITTRTHKDAQESRKFSDFDVVFFYCIYILSKTINGKGENICPTLCAPDVYLERD